ncbi:unnamed protein product [Clavelina lepadiformis]|uniref:Major facilitator superfamily (MFS) profile domain-containing protein n=1 Tax=Clavelina lepadiformis TaxID=159417 RepID=A0ABP0FN72_CLALP
MEDFTISNSYSETKNNNFYIRQRYVLAVLGFLGFFNASCLRNNVNVAILAMVNASEHNHTETKGSFSWDSSQQGLFLGSYFYGYAVANIPSGWLANKYGFRKIFTISMLASAILTLATPLAAKQGLYLAVVIRALTGFSQAALYPSMNYAWSKWAPPSEISVLYSISISGLEFGLTVVNPLVGVISDSLGWVAVFYVTGSMALVWLVFFFIFTSDAPSNNRWISKKERLYIERSIVKRENKAHDEFQGPPKTISIPWKAMLGSKRSWAFFIVHSADNWFQYTFAALMPTYMAKVFKYDTTQSGLLMILPFLMQFLVSLPASYFTDFLRKKRLMTTTQIRKINTFLALSVPALCLSLTGYVGKNHRAVISLFTFGYAFTGLSLPGYLSCPLDIAPSHSGILFAISNTIANIVGFLGPFSAGYIVADHESLLLWQNLFWASFGITITGAITFVTFGSGVEQTWVKKQVDCKQSKKPEVETRINLI